MTPLLALILAAAVHVPTEAQARRAILDSFRADHAPGQVYGCHRHPRDWRCWGVEHWVLAVPKHGDTVELLQSAPERFTVDYAGKRICVSTDEYVGVYCEVPR